MASGCIMILTKQVQEVKIKKAHGQAKMEITGFEKQ
jgi:hypothetical protein